MSATYNPIGRAGFIKNDGTFSYNPLLSDGDDIVSFKVPMKAAAFSTVQKRGTIVKYDPVAVNVDVVAAAADCNAVLAQDWDPAGTAPNEMHIYTGGKMKADAIIFPAAVTHAVATDALRSHGIFLESVMYTDGSIVKTAPTEEEAAKAKEAVEFNKNRAEPKKPEEQPSVESSDHPVAYLTAEEREKHPEWGDVKPSPERLRELGLDEKGNPLTPEERERMFTQPKGEPHTPPAPSPTHPPTHGQTHPVHPPTKEQNKK